MSEIPLSSGGRERVLPVLELTANPHPDWHESRVWELDLSRLVNDEPNVDGEWNVDGQFVQAHCSFRQVEHADIILTVPENEDAFAEKLAELKDWGCSDELVALFTDAHTSGVGLLLFWS